MRLNLGASPVHLYRLMESENPKGIQLSSIWVVMCLLLNSFRRRINRASTAHPLGQDRGSHYSNVVLHISRVYPYFRPEYGALVTEFSGWQMPLLHVLCFVPIRFESKSHKRCTTELYPSKCTFVPGEPSKLGKSLSGLNSERLKRSCTIDT